MISTLDIILRLAISVVLGGIVGFERQRRSKAAGLRTHILVSLGSCLIMIVSLNVALLLFFQHKIINTDAERIAAQVVSGIGFLGAGMIIANEKGLTIHGLTTAANLWVVAAIGLATGAGFWVAATVTTFLVYLTLTFLSKLESYIKIDPHIKMGALITHHFIITMANMPGQLGKVTNYFGEFGINIQEIRTIKNSDEESNNDLNVFISIEAPSDVSVSNIFFDLSSIDGVSAVKKADNKFIKNFV